MIIRLFVLLLILSVHCSDAQNLKTKNIFIITLDGLRWQEIFTGADSMLIANKLYVQEALELKRQFWTETPVDRRKLLMPFFWSVINNHGQLYGNRLYNNFVNCTNTMWFSYPGYSEILCGFADDERIRSNNKVNNPNVTLLEFLNRMPAYTGKVAAFGSWDVFPYIINRERSGIPVNAGFEKATGKHLSAREKFLNEMQVQIPSPWSSVRLDAFTHHYAMEYIRKNKPKVVYISYGETDDFAHDGRYDAYLRSANQTDLFIKNIWEYIQSTPAYKDKTTVLITTDHGRGTVPLESWRSHGSDVAGAGELWMAVLGPDTEGKGEMKEEAQHYQNQVAKTMASFLGVEYVNEKNTGDRIRSMFRKE